MDSIDKYIDGLLPIIQVNISENGQKMKYLYYQKILFFCYFGS